MRFPGKHVFEDHAARDRPSMMIRNDVAELKGLARNHGVGHDSSHLKVTQAAPAVDGIDDIGAGTESEHQQQQVDIRIDGRHADQDDANEKHRSPAREAYTFVTKIAEFSASEQAHGLTHMCRFPHDGIGLLTRGGDVFKDFQHDLLGRRRMPVVKIRFADQPMRERRKKQ